MHYVARRASRNLSPIFGLTAVSSSPILRVTIAGLRRRGGTANPGASPSRGDDSMAGDHEKTSAIEVKERQVGDVTILELRGRLALGEVCSMFQEKLQTLIALGHTKLLLECSHVTAIDSQGISALVRGLISARNRGGQLKLLNPSPRALHVLEITRLLTVIESFDDEAKALASF